MISAIYLVFIACISTHATNVSLVFPHSVAPDEKAENITKNLDDAEQLVKSVKETISNSCQALLPMDCEDWLNDGRNKSGVYLVWPRNRLISGAISVYCDMETDGGGWTVFQRRGDYLHEKSYFYQDWNTYKKGFGNLKEDFWLGNDNIYALSNQKLYSIRIDLGAFDGMTAYAVYSEFWINDESTSYTLHVSGYSGTATNQFSYHNGYKFSTKDRNNDVRGGNHAQLWKGGWWFHDGFRCHLNGEYHRGKPPKEWQGINWNGFKQTESLATTEMKIRKIRPWIK